jgi:nucleotide-binding universal stress UspA family protein
MDQERGGQAAEPRVVLAATDLSASADEALRQAHERARHAGARLLVCHVVPSLARANVLFPHLQLEQDAARRELQQKALHALVERTRAVTGRSASEFEALLEDGTAYARIVEVAERAGAELIVVGERGATGLSRVLLGSVAERVVRYAHAPVLVARAARRTGNVLVATDLSDASLPALAAAAREARREGVQVTALHCVEPIGVVAGAEYAMVWSAAAVAGLAKQARERAQDRLAQAVRQVGLVGQQRVVDGEPAPAILTAAEELGAELIVLGTRGRTGLWRVLLGSVAESVVRHAACSVLVVRLIGDAGQPA